jgi:hypothetical protein
MYGEVRECSQSTNVNFLPESNLWIGRTRRYQSGEITNAIDSEAGQNLTAQLCQVDPFVRGVLRGSVIEIEAIDVYV